MRNLGYHLEEQRIDGSNRARKMILAGSRSISRRFSIAFTGIITSLLLIFAALVIVLDTAKTEAELEMQFDNLMKLSKISLPTPLWNLDNEVVDDFIKALFFEKSIIFAEVVWGGRIISKKHRDTAANNSSLTFSESENLIDKTSEIFYEGNKVGTIRLVMSRERIQKERVRGIATVLVLTVLVIAAIAFTSLFVTKRYISMPLSKLQNSASAIAEGDLETRIDKSGRDEISLLAQHLDGMRGAIKDLFREVSEGKREIEDYSKTLEQKVDERTTELAKSVEEMKALSEISQVVNSTLDLDTVLTAIVRHAIALSESNGGIIFEFDDRKGKFILKTHSGLSSRLVENIKASQVLIGDKSALGRAAKSLAPFQVNNLSNEADYPLKAVCHEGYLSLLAIPFLRDRLVIGGLVMFRKEEGKFSQSIIDLLQTFASKSVMAIINAHLFREIDAKSKELETADRHKSEFLANMSHELRTPLNAILGYTELIVDEIYGEVPQPILEVLVRLEKNGRHLLDLINDILDLSKIEAGRLSLSIDQYSIVALIQDVMHSVEPLASDKGLELKSELSLDLPTGSGDEQRIAQILLNLIGNAIKFTDEGHVLIKASLSDDNFFISVSDTGCGLAEVDRGAVFDEFRQVDGSSTRKKGGTGLGLAIVKKLIEMHGGRIWVDSVLGEGADFSFVLPVSTKGAEEQP